MYKDTGFNISFMVDMEVDATSVDTASGKWAVAPEVNHEDGLCITEVINCYAYLVSLLRCGHKR